MSDNRLPNIPSRQIHPGIHIPMSMSNVRVMASWFSSPEITPSTEFRPSWAGTSVKFISALIWLYHNLSGDINDSCAYATTWVASFRTYDMFTSTSDSQGHRIINRACGVRYLKQKKQKHLVKQTKPYICLKQYDRAFTIIWMIKIVFWMSQYEISGIRGLIIITWLCGFWCEMSSIFPWHWAKLGYICTASNNLVCNEGQRVSPYFPHQTLALFMEDSINYCCQKQRQTLFSSSQIRFKYV